MRVACAAIAALAALPVVSMTATATAAPAAPAGQEVGVTPGPSDWPTDRYDNQRINNNLAETSLGPSNVGQLHLAWTTTVGGLAHNPIVIGDSVFAVCEPALCSFDRVTGALNWSTPLWDGPGAGVVSEPTYGDGLLFLGFGESVIAFDPNDGEKVWTTSFLDDPYQPNSYVQFSPVYDNGMVFVSTNSGVVHALKAATGAEVWKDLSGGMAEMSAEGGRLYADNVYDEQTGEVIGVAHPNWPGPQVIANGRVIDGLSEYAAYGNDDPFLTFARSPLAWRYPEPTWKPERPPAVAGNTLYYASGARTGGPDSHEGAGAQLATLTMKDPYYGVFAHGWQTFLPATASSVYAPSVANNVVYTQTSSGEIYAANATSGELVWRYATGVAYPGDLYWNAPVIANGMLFVVNAQQLYAFTTDPGEGTSVPARPTQLATVAGDGRVQLAWTEPSTAGTATSYRISISPSARVLTVAGTVATITGLNDWTPYTFTITAQNAAGSSPPATSAAIQPRPQFTIASVRRNGHVILYGAGKWTSIGGNATSAPAVVSVDGEPYVFVRGTDQRIWVGGPHTPWRRFGPPGMCASGPAASMTLAGGAVTSTSIARQVEVACRASDNHLLYATSPEPDSAAVPHAAAWTYSPIMLRGRPALGPVPYAHDSATGVTVGICPLKEFGAVVVYGDASTGTYTLPAYCGGSLTFADRPFANSPPMYALRDADPSDRTYLEVGQGNTGFGLIADPFRGAMGMAANASGPIVVGVNKDGDVIAQVPAPNGGWGYEQWRGFGGPNPVFVTFGHKAKYGAAATTTYTDS